MKTYRELIIQLDQVMQEIDIAREREARLITEHVLELLSEWGDVRDLVGVSAHVRCASRPVKPKYWNPETRGNLNRTRVDAAMDCWEKSEGFPHPGGLAWKRRRRRAALNRKTCGIETGSFRRKRKRDGFACAVDRISGLS